MITGYGGPIKRVLTTIGESDPTKPTYLSQLFHRRRYRALVAILRTLSKGHVKSLLDAGCGKGLLYGALVDAGIKIDSYICLDIDENKLIEAKELLLCADVQNMPVVKCSVEYSIASEVLEHLKAPFLALKDLLQITKKYLIITFPDELIKDSLGFKYPEHITRINAQEVVSLAKRYGFEQILHYRLNYMVPPSVYDKFFSYNEEFLRFLEVFQKITSKAGRLSTIKNELLVFKRIKAC